MEIENTKFGTITIDGKTYEHDVVIRLSGEVVKRKKKLSKKYYGTSHVLSKDEAKFVFEKGCEQLIVVRLPGWTLPCAHARVCARVKSLKNFRSVPRRATSTPGRLAARKTFGKFADECLISGDN